MGTCTSSLIKKFRKTHPPSSRTFKGKKNTRRRLSISTKGELPNDTDEIKRSIQELKDNEDRFKESSENDSHTKVEITPVKEEEEKKCGEKKNKIKNRSSVAGVRASHFQEDFEKKCVKIKGEVDKLNENGIGYVCRKGLKPESPNQDDFTIITTENLALYAIFDGHGPYGHDVSNYVQKELPYMIIKNENFLKNPKEVFTKAFLNIHANIEKTTNEYLEDFANKYKGNNKGGNSRRLHMDKQSSSSVVSTHFDLNIPHLDDEEEDDDDDHDSDDDNNFSEDSGTGNTDGYAHTDSDSDSDSDHHHGESDDNENQKKSKAKMKKSESNKHANEKNTTKSEKGQALNKKKKKKKKKKEAYFDSTMSGTTATIIVHLFQEKKLYVAYVGDSRAVLGRRKKGFPDVLEAFDLTKDHKPNSAAEKKRIINSGGQVLKLEGDIPYRVFLKNKFYPGLAMSRAIGDTIGHQIGIISEPDFMEIKINEDEDILVLICSDGVWEFISSEEAINLIYEFGYDNVQDAVENLAKESWDRWLNEEENIVDDITIQAIYLSEKCKKIKNEK
ncbi:protein phosphatase 2C, putative [Plasmodium knowlesi strain H]|uniref:Protein phosphatase 2C, putative n=2 Tax=Plasmodium knowlesi (strain H) TaxID=5851 RepID=A0A5K1UFE6_PLAKH|nr:protein phosphatase PPM5, putative [Plasmodium knowlesi strain H]CAA9990901.1 protein phosphatase PPM5, putative [Plasmodium knowlesi strain H]SBO20875.1 protein phosphatase 2C, putative [Plasmodium knowlesi strain H]SBO21319.1 protein phosphatase 2C, putative [Plasmodium knowlesi strain H]VVS80375.1 protein phosphatase PPM5, putative [Plasmodium knowlesi strain H]|eukprot:XP_002262187.1 protein phosphatase 2C, putative [Plasmodium knowlesi strain H]